MGHAWQGHQEPDAVVVMGERPQLGVERVEFGVDGVVEPQEAIDGAPCVLGELEASDPGQPFGHEQPPLGQDDQEPGEDAVDAVLEPRAVGHQGRPHACQVPQPLGDAVGHPDFGEEVAPEQVRQNHGVDLVGLHLGLGDGPDLHGIAHDDRRDEGVEDGGHGPGAGRRLDRQPVGGLEACPGEGLDGLALADDGMTREDADLQGVLVEVESDESHGDASGCVAIEPMDRGDRTGRTASTSSSSWLSRVGR